MSVFMAISGLVAVLVCAKLFHLNKGLAAGLVVGLLIGLIAINISGIPLTLGSGGGCLLSGLLFGWMRGKHPMYGVMPASASQLLRDFGLAAFVAVMGLNAGLQAVVTIKQSGLTIFLPGLAVTMVPLLLTLLFGRYVLRYNNAAILAGAIRIRSTTTRFSIWSTSARRCSAASSSGGCSSRSSPTNCCSGSLAARASCCCLAGGLGRRIRRGACRLRTSTSRTIAGSAVRCASSRKSG